MSVANIVDDRSNRLDINCCVVAEHSSHDNDAKGATQFSMDDQNEMMYQELFNTTIEKAISWGNKFKCPITLYLYDCK